MHLQQFYLGCLAHASYLIGDEATGTAVVVDPRRDIDLYLEAAEARGLTIRHVFLTHFHADFVAGHLELRERLGVEVHLGARAEAEFPFTPAREGEPLEFGSVRLEFLETPGHTPEGISIVVYDLDTSADAPEAVLTGDTLFVGDVGRPDLLASIGVTPDELAHSLYHSLHDKLLQLPDDTRVYPAHGAGSLCGKDLGSETWSTLGAQRASNPALQPMSEDEFVAMVKRGQPAAPRYFLHDAILNRREHETLETALERGLAPLSLSEVLRARNRGAVLLDTRSPESFAAGHLEGSLAISLEGSFASWAGTLISARVSIVVIADPGREQEAVTRLGRIGFGRVVGFLEGGSAAWQEHPERVSHVGAVSPEELVSELDALQLGARPAPAILDVRTEREHESGALSESLNLPLAGLPSHTDALPRDRPLVILCANDSRSSTAASLVLAAGLDRVSTLTGGWTALERLQAGRVS